MKKRSVLLVLSLFSSMLFAQASKEVSAQPASSDKKQAAAPNQANAASAAPVKLTPEEVKKLVASEEKRHAFALKFIKENHDFQLKHLNEMKQLSTEFENKLYEYTKGMVRSTDAKVITHFNNQRTKLTEDFQANQKAKVEKFTEEMNKRLQTFEVEIKKLLPQ